MVSPISKKGPRIIVVGSSNSDLVVHCNALPKPGETVLGGTFAPHHGGKGANQAVAAARAGAQVIFIGAHGKDAFGRAAKAALRREGIDVRHFREIEGVPSGVALIMVGGRSKENLIAVARSANDRLAPEDVQAVREAFRACSAVVCQLEIPLETVLAAAELAVRNAVPFILNPAPARKLPPKLFKVVHTIVPNVHEAAVLTGREEPKEAARCLIARGCKNVVITLGSKGALVVTARQTINVSTRKVKPVDTVGAGDCFTGWLTVGIAEEMDVFAAAQRAAVAASIAVSRRGAQDGMPYRKEVEDLDS